MERLNSGYAHFINQAPIDMGGGLRVDFEKRIAIRPDGSQVRLSKGDIDIFRALADGWLTSQELDERVSILRGDAVTIPHSVSFIPEKINRLRRKLRDDPENPSYIISRKGWGYKLAPDEE